MKKKHRKYLFYLISLIALAIVLGIGATGGYFYSQRTNQTEPVSTNEEKNIHSAFLLEIYDKIKENYWDILSEAELNNYFKLGSEKLVGGSHNPEPNNKQGLEKMLGKILKDLNQDQKKEFSAKLATIVLQNLQPLGRSGLYTTQDEENLKNRVQNINPEKDLYQDLGLGKGASQEEIRKAYQEKITQLEKQDNEKAKQGLDKVKYAYRVLSDSSKKTEI
jgi:hypothetical protein